MNVIRVNLNQISSTTFDLGFVGEKNHTKVIIVCTSLFRKYPDAVCTMVASPPVGELYPVEVEKDGNTVVWEVSESDISHAGSGEYQLTFTDGEGDTAEVIKTVYGAYSVKESLEATGEPPTPFESWLAEAREALASFQQDVSDAEAWAVGTRGGVDVESTDPTYHNNAKYYGLNVHVDGTKLIIS